MNGKIYPLQKQIKSKQQLIYFAFLLESTMIATKEGSEYTTQTIERTQKPGSHFGTTKQIIVFTGTIISSTLIIVILWKYYRYRRFIRPVQQNNLTDALYANVAGI